MNKFLCSYSKDLSSSLLLLIDPYQGFSNFVLLILNSSLLTMMLKLLLLGAALTLKGATQTKHGPVLTPGLGGPRTHNPELSEIYH
jgi:hypothetical protein